MKERDTFLVNIPGCRPFLPPPQRQGTASVAVVCRRGRPTMVGASVVLRLAPLSASLSSLHVCCARGDLTFAGALEAPSLKGAGAIDAHGSAAFVAGEGVTAVEVSDPATPRVVTTLEDPLLVGCKSVYAYTTVAEQGRAGERRLAVACSGSHALVLVGVGEGEGNLRVLGSVAEPVALKGAAGVVVKGTLAFVAASGVARVVSVDVRDEGKPRVLSSVRLSAASTVALHGENHLIVGSGPGRRVTVLSYVPSGVLMKTGSIKDGRLEGQSSIVHVFYPNPNITFAVTAANGGTFAVINTTTRVRPAIAVALQAEGRAAASVPLTQAAEEAEGGGVTATGSWSPNGHKALEGASGLALASNGIAYVTGSDNGAVAGIDATDPTRPQIVRQVTDPRLVGATDLCANGGDAGNAPEPGVAKPLDGTGTAVVYVVVPDAQRLVVLRDSGGNGGKRRRSEL